MAPSPEINIPQKPPMVMVDRLILAAGRETVTSFLIREDNVFADQGVFTEPGLIENMAQTAAAGTGALPGAAGAEPRKGFIGAIKNLRIEELPRVGTEITTRVSVEYNVMDASVIQAEVRQGNKLLAACEMKIFLMS